MKKDFLASVFGDRLDATKSEAYTSLQVEFDQFKTEAAIATGVLTEQLEEQVKKNTELTAKIQELSAFAEAAEAEKVRLAEEAKQKLASDRKEKIVAAVGTEKADALVAATEGMDEAAFNAVMSAVTVAGEKESKSAMFNEVGASADVEADKVNNESAEMRIIREKNERQKRLQG
jgi:hypothetical protein